MKDFIKLESKLMNALEQEGQPCERLRRLGDVTVALNKLVGKAGLEVKDVSYNGSTLRYSFMRKRRDE